MITNETVGILFIIAVLCICGIVLYKRQETPTAKAKPAKMQLCVYFTDGFDLVSQIPNPYEAQKAVNRFIWAGISRAYVTVNGNVEYEFNSDGLLVYKPCKS